MKILRTLAGNEPIPEDADPSTVRLDLDGTAYIVEHPKIDLTEYYASMAADAGAPQPARRPDDTLEFSIVG